MRTGKNQKKLLALTISLALAGSVSYASPANTVTIENQSTGQKEIAISSDRLPHSDNSTINQTYDNNSGNAAYEITAVSFGNVNNYALSVAAGNSAAQRASGSGSGDIVFNGLRWEGGTGNTLTLGAGVYTATAGVGSAASLDRATLQKYSGTLTINGLLGSTAKGGSGSGSQKGGSAKVKGLTIANGSTVTINGAAANVTSIATGGAGKDDVDSDYGNGGSAAATGVTMSGSSVNGTLNEVTASATGGNAGSNTNTSAVTGTTARGDGGEATATSLIVNNSQTAETFTTETITATAIGGSGGDIENAAHSLAGNGGTAAATGVQVTDGSIFTQKGATEIEVSAAGGSAAATDGSGGSAMATGVEIKDSTFTHEYTSIMVEAGSGQSYGGGTSGDAVAKGLALTNSKALGSIDMLTVNATANISETGIGLAAATGLSLSNGQTEETVGIINIEAHSGFNDTIYGNANSTGVKIDQKGKLKLATGMVMVTGNATVDGITDKLNGGIATSIGISGDTDTIVEVSGVSNPTDPSISSGLTIDVKANALGTGDINGSGIGTDGRAYATAIKSSASEMSFKTRNQAIAISATTDIAGASETNQAFAVDASQSKLTFDAGTSTLSFTGDVKAIDGTVHFYGSDIIDTRTGALTTAGTTISAGINTDTNLTGLGSNGNLDLSGSTVDTSSSIALNGPSAGNGAVLKLGGSTLYLYKNDGKALYDTNDYHTVSANSMADTSALADKATTALYLRTDSSAGKGDSLRLNNISAGTDKTAYTIRIFDKGMKTGFQGTNEYDANHHILIQNASSNATNTTYTAADDIAYDNGVWSYTYTPTVAISEDGKNLELAKVTTKSVAASAANLTAADAHAASAASSIAFTHKRLDTLGQHFGALRQNAETENGFWVKYLGGRLDVSLHRDTDIDYNGVQVGYDHRTGGGWAVGFAGSYLKGDADYAYGSGDIKDTSFAIYGTQRRTDGSYLDLVAQFGKLKNGMTAYGGSVAQRIDSNFDSNVYALSAKYGKRQTKENGSYVEPSFQLVYSNLGSDNYNAATRDNIMHVYNDATNSLLLSTGVELGQKLGQKTNAYLRAALQYEFLGDIKTRVTADNRTAFYDESFNGFSLAWGLGVDHQMNETSSLHLDLSRVDGGDLKESWAVNAMCRVFF